MSPPRLASPDSFEEQAIEVFEKIDDLLKECGLTRDDIFETTVMLVSKHGFLTMDRLYREFFTGIEILPERAAYCVAWLPFESKIEIRFIAIKQG
jgi:2-iminobutanoate/2-iminopropanoate deaminase